MAQRKKVPPKMDVSVIDEAQLKNAWTFAGIDKNDAPWVNEKRVARMNKKFGCSIDPRVLCMRLVTRGFLQDAHIYAVGEIQRSTGRLPTNIGVFSRDDAVFIALIPDQITPVQTQLIALDKLEEQNALIQTLRAEQTKKVNAMSFIDVIYFEPECSKTHIMIIQWLGFFSQKIVLPGQIDVYFKNEDEMRVYAQEYLLKYYIDLALPSVRFVKCAENIIVTLNGAGPWDAEEGSETEDGAQVFGSKIFDNNLSVKNST